MKDPNEPIFTRTTLEGAMATNCGYYHGHSVKERFAVETPAVVDALDHILKNVSTVMDYGIGVGRITKAILERYPHIKVIGVDNSERMLHFAGEYLPGEYFSQGRVSLRSTDSMDRIPLGSVDLAISVYVLLHVSSENIPWTLGEIGRSLKDKGKLYVLDKLGRAVPKSSRWGLYKGLRRMSGFIDHLASHKQAQRMLVKLDNKVIFTDDGVDMQEELAKNFRPAHDIPLENCTQLLNRLMRSHFSRVYTKI